MSGGPAPASSSEWRWAHQGTPGGTTNLAYNSPEAITHKDESGRQRIYVFVKGSDNRLHVNYWDGFAWRWADQGRPVGTNVADVVAATSYRYVIRDRFYALVRGSNNRIYANVWDGSSWQWQDAGTPPGTTVYTLHGVTAYADPARRAYAFAMESNGGFYVNYTLNTAVTGGRNWAFQGAP